MDGTTQVLDAPPPSIKSRGLRYPKADFMTSSMRIALRKDKYETPMLAACIRTALPEDIVLDLGAGLGAVSATLSKREGVQEIHAFEANPELVAYLPRMFALNDVTNVTVTHGTLGKRKGTADFHVRKNPSLSSLHERDSSPVASIEKIDVLNAKTVFKQIAPTLLIVDVEGAEADIIPDLDLGDLRAAVVKIHPKWIGPEGVNAVFAAMMSAGLQYHARGSMGKVVAFRRAWPTA